jgi:MFS family permease
VSPVARRESIGLDYNGRPLKPGLPVVYFTVFLDLVGFGIILPQLPYYAEAFGATGVWVGAILTAYSAAQLVGASSAAAPSFS